MCELRSTRMFVGSGLCMFLSGRFCYCYCCYSPQQSLLGLVCVYSSVDLIIYFAIVLNNIYWVWFVYVLQWIVFAIVHNKFTGSGLCMFLSGRALLCFCFVCLFVFL